MTTVFALWIVGPLVVFISTSCSRKGPPSEVIQARPMVEVHTVVEPSETAESIARLYSVPVEDLCRLNGVEASTPLVKGQRITLLPQPGYSPGISQDHGTWESAQPIVQQPLETAEEKLPEPIEPPVASETKPACVWPVQGRLLRRFGDRLKNGSVNEGLNISAPANTLVKAVADGWVIDSGELVVGFGKMVILDLDNGYVAIYGHLQEVTVKKPRDGEPVRVRQGQTIGRVGKTGNVRVPQLHFQLRDSSKKPVNPLKLLPPLNSAEGTSLDEA